MRRPPFLLLLLALNWAPLQAACLVIEPVQVIDLRGGAVLRDQALLIEDRLIRALLPAGQAGNDCAGRIDGQGGYVIPGLAEMHAHVPAMAQGEAAVQRVLDLFLANGVTTIRGMLGEPGHLELRDQLASSAWRGPRLITSGPSFNGQSISSPEQGAQRAREQAAAGYDFLKIHPGLSRAEFEAIAASARELGLPFAGHVSFETGLEMALAMHQTCIDHLDAYAEAMVPPGSPLAGVAPSWFGLNLASAFDHSRIESLAQQTARAGVWNAPTQSLFETTVGTSTIDELLARPGMEMLSEGLRSTWIERVKGVRQDVSGADRAAFLDARRRLIKALQDAGAGLVLGSDAPQIMNVPGYSAHQELAYLVAAGLTPLQALQTGTLNVARYFGETDRGEIAPGFIADIVLLRDNPLSDIGATTGILGVVQGGAWLDRQALDQLLDSVRGQGL